MSVTGMERELGDLLVGCGCVEVTYVEESDGWVFHFTRDCSINADCPWRIVSGGGIALGSGDHGHQFGLPAPIDGPKLAKSLLAGHSITETKVRDNSGDLFLEFEGGVSLELLNNSAGYEGWQCHSPKKAIVGLGGGRVALFEPEHENEQHWSERPIPRSIRSPQEG